MTANAGTVLNHDNVRRPIDGGGSVAGSGGGRRRHRSLPPRSLHHADGNDDQIADTLNSFYYSVSRIAIR